MKEELKSVSVDVSQEIGKIEITKTEDHNIKDIKSRLAEKNGIRNSLLKALAKCDEEISELSDVVNQAKLLGIE